MYPDGIKIKRWNIVYTTVETSPIRKSLLLMLWLWIWTFMRFFSWLCEKLRRKWISLHSTKGGRAKHTAITACSLYLFIVLLAITHHKWGDSRWNQSSQNSNKQEKFNLKCIIFFYKMYCNNAFMLLYLLSVSVCVCKHSFPIFKYWKDQLFIVPFFSNISQFLSTFIYTAQPVRVYGKYSRLCCKASLLQLTKVFFKCICA